jgi:hypothetical protein
MEVVMGSFEEACFSASCLQGLIETTSSLSSTVTSRTATEARDLPNTKQEG